MKKYLLILFMLISLSAFAQPGSLSQSVYRSRVNDTTAVVGSTSSGYGYFFWNNQRAVPVWQFWNGTSLVDFNPDASGASGSPQHSYDATGTNTYTTTIDDGNFDGYPGAVVFIKFQNTNSGPSSLAVNGGGAVSIVWWDGDSFEVLPSGYIKTEIIYRLSYSTNDDFFQIDRWDNAGAVTAVGGTSARIDVSGGAFTPIIDISASYAGQSSITTTGTLTSGATGAGFTVALGTSTVTGALPVANLTAKYILDSATPSTAGGTITLDMNSQIQRLFVGSASFSTPKTLAISNATNALVFNFHFQITDIAATLTLPSGWLMSDALFASNVWTPVTTGLYELGGSFDGTNWKIKIMGPFN